MEVVDPVPIFSRFASYGPTLPTCALQQVGSYLGYISGDADIVAEAAHDPQETLTIGRPIGG